MIKLTDGKQIAEVEMIGINGFPWEHDFFEVGGLPYDGENNTYKVEDVDYCISQMKDYFESKGDFQDCGKSGENESYCYWIEEVE